ncbi:MAG: winged helix-turn-helix transcriptional regulator [Acidimicrobiia bacterium]
MIANEPSSTPPGMYKDLDCSVARTLEQIGERWTFLILRDSFYGIRRFADFQDSLGIAKNILASRLTSLVESGIMRKEQYQEHPPRYEYRLTEKGRDLVPMLTTLLAWGDKWATDGEDPVKLTHTDCGAVMHTMTVCGHCQEPINAFNLGIDPIPEIVQKRVLEGRLATHQAD